MARAEHMHAGMYCITNLYTLWVSLKKKNKKVVFKFYNLLPHFLACSICCRCNFLVAKIKYNFTFFFLSSLSPLSPSMIFIHPPPPPPPPPPIPPPTSPLRSRVYRRIKLMVVGEANKGKTSLLLSLTRRGKMTPFKKVALGRHREPLATDGVELGDWEYAPARREKVTFMTWDFGGQVSGEERVGEGGEGRGGRGGRGGEGGEGREGVEGRSDEGRGGDGGREGGKEGGREGEREGGRERRRETKTVKYITKIVAETHMKVICMYSVYRIPTINNLCTTTQLTHVYVLYCTVLCCAVLYCTVLCCTVLCCAVLYCTVLCCAVLYCTVLYCTVLYCTVLYCTVLCCAVLYCTVLY